MTDETSHSTKLANNPFYAWSVADEGKEKTEDVAYAVRTLRGLMPKRQTTKKDVIDDDDLNIAKTQQPKVYADELCPICHASCHHNVDEEEEIHGAKHCANVK